MSYLVTDRTTAPQDRRADARIRTIYRSARATSRDDSGLCRVLNLSDGGALIETTLTLGLGDQLMLELADGLAMNGFVARREGLLAGVKFAPRIDCITMLKQSSDDRWNGRGRPVRLVVNKQVEVISESEASTLELKDISQKGLRVCADGKLTPGMQVRIRLNPDLVVDGKVCWAQDSDVGVKLQGQITILDLGSVATFARGKPEIGPAAEWGRRCSTTSEMAKARAE